MKASQTRSRTRRPRPWLLALLLFATATTAWAEHPNALWRVVRICTIDKRWLGGSAPCTAVDVHRGVVVVKDLGAATHYLLVPTRRIGGIESVELQAPDAPNYWAAAWDARRWLDAAAKRPLARDEVALAINSIAGRSQNQLHIHIECVRPDVRRALIDDVAAAGSTWAALGLDLPRRRYRARWIDGADLGSHDPFKLLAEDPAAHADMSRYTLVLIGATRVDGSPGFLLLSDRADPERHDAGHGEELLGRCPAERPAAVIPAAG